MDIEQARKLVESFGRTSIWQVNRASLIKVASFLLDHIDRHILWKPKVDKMGKCSIGCQGYQKATETGYLDCCKEDLTDGQQLSMYPSNRCPASK
jgi:hypothetical protein